VVVGAIVLVAEDLADAVAAGMLDAVAAAVADAAVDAVAAAVAASVAAGIMVSASSRGMFGRQPASMPAPSCAAAIAATCRNRRRVTGVFI